VGLLRLISIRMELMPDGSVIGSHYPSAQARQDKVSNISRTRNPTHESTMPPGHRNKPATALRCMRMAIRANAQTAMRIAAPCACAPHVRSLRVWAWSLLAVGCGAGRPGPERVHARSPGPGQLF
jgi:hypothetical protein